MTVMAPKNRQELTDMLRFALGLGCPVSIRYPRGAAYDGLRSCRAPIELGRAEMICDEGGVLLLAVGSMVKTAEQVKERLQAQGVACSIANARFVRPLDTELLRKAAEKYSMIVTMEENIHSGGFGEHVAAWYEEEGLAVSLLNISIPDGFIVHGTPEELSRLTGIDAESIVKKITEKSGS
jgi:1-deoxy-D-xylulose-5-phosphate synthase